MRHHVRRVSTTLLTLACSLALFCLAPEASWAAGPKKQVHRVEMNQDIVTGMTAQVMATGVILVDTNISGSEVVIGWDGSNLAVLQNNTPLTNFETGYDSNGRPAFRSDQMSGTFELDPNGTLITIIRGITEEPVRLALVDGTTSVLGRANCNCFGTGTGGTQTTCKNKDCDEGNSCQTGGTGGRNCRWSAAHNGGGPINIKDEPRTMPVTNE